MTIELIASKIEEGVSLSDEHDPFIFAVETNDEETQIALIVSAADEKKITKEEFIMAVEIWLSDQTQTDPGTEIHSVNYH